MVKMQRLQFEEILQRTQDSVISWDEVNLNSIQGVCVDESVATSTSSVSRLAETALSHLPQAGSGPELFQRRGHTMPKAASQFGRSSGYATSEHLERLLVI